MAIQTEEWDELVAVIKTFPQAYQDIAAIAFRMGHEEGWWLARTDPDSTVSPPAHEAEVNPFNGGMEKITVPAYSLPQEPEPVVRWAVEYRGIYEYESEEEARRQFALASWDVPAALVKSTDGGKTWVIVPAG